MNKYLYRAKLREIRTACSNPAGATGSCLATGSRWTTTYPTGSGFFYLKIIGDQQTSPIRLVFDKHDLYIQGFITQHGNFKFDNARWDINAVLIGYDDDYDKMGWDRSQPYASFTSDYQLNVAISNVANAHNRAKWSACKNSVVQLVLAFAEGARMHNIQKCVENGIAITDVKWDSSRNDLALHKG